MLTSFLLSQALSWHSKGCHVVRHSKPARGSEGPSQASLVTTFWFVNARGIKETLCLNHLLKTPHPITAAMGTRFLRLQLWGLYSRVYISEIDACVCCMYTYTYISCNIYCVTRVYITTIYCMSICLHMQYNNYIIVMQMVSLLDQPFPFEVK